MFSPTIFDYSAAGEEIRVVGLYIKKICCAGGAKTDEMAFAGYEGAPHRNAQGLLISPQWITQAMYQPGRSSLGERLWLLPIMAKLRELSRCPILQVTGSIYRIHTIRGGLWYLLREQA